MPVHRADQPTVFALPGSTFRSYASPARGSAELCAWRYQVEAGVTGAAHRPTREEVFLVLDGELHGALDGEAFALRPGDVLVVPAGSQLRVDGGPVGASAWVTTSAGIQAETPTGTITPPWTA